MLQSFFSDTDEAAVALRTLSLDCTRQHHWTTASPRTPSTMFPWGDNGAAILDSLEYAVDLLRTMPTVYRHAILLISGTLDRGSETTGEPAVRDSTDNNTTI